MPTSPHILMHSQKHKLKALYKQSLLFHDVHFKIKYKVIHIQYTPNMHIDSYKVHKNMILINSPMTVFEAKNVQLFDGIDSHGVNDEISSIIDDLYDYTLIIDK